MRHLGRLTLIDGLVRNMESNLQWKRHSTIRKTAYALYLAVARAMVIPGRTGWERRRNWYPVGISVLERGAWYLIDIREE